MSLCRRHPPRRRPAARMAPPTPPAGRAAGDGGGGERSWSWLARCLAARRGCRFSGRRGVRPLERIGDRLHVGRELRQGLGVADTTDAVRLTTSDRGHREEAAGGALYFSVEDDVTLR